MPPPRIIDCKVCRDLFNSHDREGQFERWGQGQPVRLINNPAVWGADRPRFTLLGFSKGNTQNKAIAEARSGRLPLESVPFKGMRKRLAWLLDAIGLRRQPFEVDRIFEDGETEIRSASLIRCSVSARGNGGRYSYKLADVLAADAAAGGTVREVIRRCVRTHAVPGSEGQTFVVLGLDRDQIEWTRSAFASELGPLESVTETTYRNSTTSWVHVAHPSGNQTDPQYQRWCRGEGRKPKVLWAREEIARRGAGRR